MGRKGRGGRWYGIRGYKYVVIKCACLRTRLMLNKEPGEDMLDLLAC